MLCIIGNLQRDCKGGGRNLTILWSQADKTDYMHVLKINNKHSPITGSDSIICHTEIIPESPGN